MRQFFFLNGTLHLTLVGFDFNVVQLNTNNQQLHSLCHSTATRLRLKQNQKSSWDLFDLFLISDIQTVGVSWSGIFTHIWSFFTLQTIIPLVEFLLCWITYYPGCLPAGREILPLYMTCGSMKSIWILDSEVFTDLVLSLL